MVVHNADAFPMKEMQVKALLFLSNDQNLFYSLFKRHFYLFYDLDLLIRSLKFIFFIFRKNLDYFLLICYNLKIIKYQHHFYACCDHDLNEINLFISFIVEFKSI